MTQRHGHYDTGIFDFNESLCSNGLFHQQNAPALVRNFVFWQISELTGQ
jgi:hypothetical protein